MIIFKLKALKHFLTAQKQVKHKIPSINKQFSIFKRVDCLLHGFTTDKLLWYDFKKYGYKDYISDWNHHYLTEHIDKHQYFVANDKLVCERMIMPFCNILPTIGYIFRGCYYPIGSNGIEFEALVNELKNGQDFFCKPTGGGSGRGIGCLSYHNDSYYWNDQSITEIKKFVLSLSTGTSGYVVQRRFNQIGFSHDANPDTLNTVRIVTMMDPETQQPFLAYACHRMGRKGAFVDNIAKNNLLCPVDINSGIIMDVLVPPTNGKLTHLEKHPDTGIQIKGIKVPKWEECVDVCFNLAKQLPFMPLCGWDVIISEEKVFIQEQNYNPDIYLGQTLYPLLKDNKVKKFISYYKI